MRGIHLQQSGGAGHRKGLPADPSKMSASLHRRGKGDESAAENLRKDIEINGAADVNRVQMGNITRIVS